MEKIASFTVDHEQLLPGLYLSRRDGGSLGSCSSACGMAEHSDSNVPDSSPASCIVSTFDMRFTAPNREPVLDVPAVHTIEHIGATYLRNCERRGDVIYFGPMGCRTGFYLVMFGELTVPEIAPLVVNMCDFILGYEGEVPGAQPAECGNYSDHNLAMAKYYVQRYRSELTEHQRFTYPA